MTSMTPWYARDARAWTCPAPDSAAQEFHRQLPGYAPTPLVEAPELSAEPSADQIISHMADYMQLELVTV